MKSENVKKLKEKKMVLVPVPYSGETRLSVPVVYQKQLGETAHCLEGIVAGAFRQGSEFRKIRKALEGWTENNSLEGIVGFDRRRFMAFELLSIQTTLRKWLRQNRNLIQLKEVIKD